MKTLKTFLIESLNVKDISSWKQEGDRLGSNPGGIHTTPSGEKHYVKFYSNPDQARAEYTTNQIYKHMGIHTPNLTLVKKDNKIGVASEWNSKLKTIQPHEFHQLKHEQASQIGRMYHAAVLTKNWDIVGLEHDNILKDETGNLHSIDQGGSLHFRAMGSHKDYHDDVNEIHSLKNEGLPSGHVFNHNFKTHPHAEKEGLEAVKKINPEHIKNIFKESGLHNHEQLSNTFLERRKNLIKHY